MTKNIIVILIACIFQLNSIRSCDCPQNPETELPKIIPIYSNIFKGNVSNIKISITQSNNTNTSSLIYNEISFNSIISVKGTNTNQTNYYTNSTEDSCGIQFTIGQEWLIYANLTENNITISLCSPTKLFISTNEASKSELSQLQAFMYVINSLAGFDLTKLNVTTTNGYLLSYNIVNIYILLFVYMVLVY